VSRKVNRTRTLDDNTYASNPGGLEIDYLYWFRSFPKQPTALLLAILPFFSLAIFITGVFGWALLGSYRRGTVPSSWPLSALGALIADSIAFGFMFEPLKALLHLLIGMREHFLYGCVNPGIVVSTTPPLVAVLTDLTVSKSPHPVIKILPQPFWWYKREIPPVGTRLATIALYRGMVAKGHWDDFDPIVINAVTGHQADITRVFQSIPAGEWEQLEIALEHLQDYIRTHKPGLHYIYFVQCPSCGQNISLPLYPRHKMKHLNS
jgi:hypothetical protein